MKLLVTRLEHQDPLNPLEDTEFIAREAHGNGGHSRAYRGRGQQHAGDESIGRWGLVAGSFSAALSGLNANAIALSVIGNNLANTNTIGFKSSTVTFHDLVSQTLKLGGGGGNPVQIGLGVITGTISPVFSQGSIESTREPINVAIQGEGFFMVAKEDGSAYTRAGDFSFDADGRLVSSDGDARSRVGRSLTRRLAIF